MPSCPGFLCRGRHRLQTLSPAPTPRCAARPLCSPFQHSLPCVHAAWLVLMSSGSEGHQGPPFGLLGCSDCPFCSGKPLDTPSHPSPQVLIWAHRPHSGQPHPGLSAGEAGIQRQSWSCQAEKQVGCKAGEGMRWALSRIHGPNLSCFMAVYKFQDASPLSCAVS